MAVDAVFETFDVVSSGADCVVGVLVGLVALARAPPVLTATPGGFDVVIGPVDVEAMVEVDVVAPADVFEGSEDAADLDAPVVELLVDELVDDDLPTDAEEVESEDDGLDGSAHAIPWLVNRTEPTPSATTRPPIRPTYASPRTRQLYRLQRIDMPTTGRLAWLATSMSIHLVNFVVEAGIEPRYGFVFGPRKCWS